MMIQSFTRDPELWYQVKVQDIKIGTEDSAAIISCDCPDFKMHQLKCKHMFLAGRFSGIPLRFSHTHTQTPFPRAAPITSISQSDVLLQKQAGLSRIVQEGKKIEGLIEKLAALNLGDVSRDQLGDLEARSISLRRELYDVVNSRPLYAPQH